MEECKKYNEKELKEKLLNVKDLVIEYKNNEDTYREVIKLLRKYISFVEAYELRREIRKKEIIKVLAIYILFNVLVLFFSLMIFNFIALTPAIIISISTLILYYNFPKKDEYLVKGKNAYKEALELIDMYENVLKSNLLNSNKELLRIINSELRECLSYINNNKNKEFSEIIENKEIDENTENNIIKSFMDNLVKYYNEEELIISDSQKKLVK